MGYNPQLVTDTRAKIASYLQQRNWPFEEDESGAYRLYQGSTYVSLTVKQWGENTLICIRSPLSIDVTNMSSELAQMLLEKNYDLILGKFSYNRNNRTIYYENALMGSDLDPSELYSAVEAAAVVADKYDDQIAKYSGGRRAID
ncbi:MAG: hypothetical protein SCALA702_38280 [Melioribacteraceae bacterium]|nr:MAG: hypothetical protein SCALA702_38280 [Melioribacteraceae bacterium]